VPDLPRQLVEIARLASEHRAPITSLLILPACGQQRSHRIVLRVATIVVAPFARALREAGIDLDPPETAESPVAANV
jgi:hypothetical protein